MKRLTLPALLVLSAWAVAACDEETPTAVSDDLLPVTARTVEVRLPWGEFATDLQVFGGFGAPEQLGTGVLARDFRGVLDARTLIRYGNLNTRQAVTDTTGTTVGDSIFVFKGGRLVARFDTLASTNDGPVTVSAHRLTTPWHSTTTTWKVAVDTAGDRSAWPEEGAGPAEPIGSGVWDPAEGDSLVLDVDSATVAMWADTTDSSRGLRLDVESEGVRVEVLTVLLRYDVIPSVNPDTLLNLTTNPRQLTFIYDPFPEPPPDGIRIGGAPAWRTVIWTRVPEVLEGPPALCEALGCPFRLRPDRISHASLVLNTRRSEPAAFEPTDTVRMDVRTVLAPERLPKAPLSGPFEGLAGRPVPPSAFGEEAPTEIAVAVTAFVRGQVAELEEGDPEPASTLALLSAFEPLSIAFASFVGPGGEGEPFLRLILTSSDTVELP